MAALSSAAVLTIGGPGEGATGIVRVQPLSVELRFARDTVTPGQRTVAWATIRNHADQPLADGLVRLRMDEQRITIRDGGERHLGDLRVGQTIRVAWQLCALATGDEPVVYLGIAQVSATDGARRWTTESLAEPLEVVGRPRRATCSSP